MSKRPRPDGTGGGGHSSAGKRGSYDKGKRPQTTINDYDKAYFERYTNIGVHEILIKDLIRTDAYKAAITKKRQGFIEGKVVLDVGCGTGILSIFCAFAGAKRVYAIEASDIAVKAEEVVKANNLSNIITVLHGRVEDVEINEKVDVIISDWMGHMLLLEGMLSSVITARNRWLKPGGLMMPSFATLYMAPIEHNERYKETIHFWADVYEINMSEMMPSAKLCAFQEPCVETISAENVIGTAHRVKYIDLYDVTINELETVTATYKFWSQEQAIVHGFAFWFDVEFNDPKSTPVQLLKHHVLGSLKPARQCEDIVLSTAPDQPPTHWQQTIVYFYDPIELGKEQFLEGSLELSQSRQSPRFLNIRLVCTNVVINHLERSLSCSGDQRSTFYLSLNSFPSHLHGSDSGNLADSCLLTLVLQQIEANIGHLKFSKLLYWHCS